jgi:hypothetical protein
MAKDPAASNEVLGVYGRPDLMLRTGMVWCVHYFAVQVVDISVTLDMAAFAGTELLVRPGQTSGFAVPFTQAPAAGHRQPLGVVERAAQTSPSHCRDNWRGS